MRKVSVITAFDHSGNYSYEEFALNTGFLQKYGWFFSKKYIFGILSQQTGNDINDVRIREFSNYCPVSAEKYYFSGSLMP